MATPCGLWDLSSPTRNRTLVPAVKAPSPNHWTTREFPKENFKNLLTIKLLVRAESGFEPKQYNTRNMFCFVFQKSAFTQCIMKSLLFARHCAQCYINIVSSNPCGGLFAKRVAKIPPISVGTYHSSYQEVEPISSPLELALAL